MKNTKKSFLAIMMLASCLVVSACSCGGGTCEPTHEVVEKDLFPKTNLPDIFHVVPAAPAVEKIMVEKDTYSLFVEDTAQINVSFLPRRKEAPKCVYTSSDANVATVDENGVISAIGAGVADISVSVNDGQATENLKVYVYATTNATKGKSTAKKIKVAQAAGGVTKIAEAKELVEQVTFEGDNITSTIKEFTTLKASIDDAYFAIEEIDETAKTSGGSISYESFKYVFYTNEGYDTYIFKEAGKTRNYCVINTTSFIGVGTRFDALKAVMENYFTSGSSIMTRVLEYSVGGYNNSGESKIEELVSDYDVKKQGTNSDDSLYVNQLFTYKNQRSDADWEENWGIPADAKFDVNIYENYNFVNNYVANFNFVQEMLWNYNGVANGAIFGRADSIKTTNVKLDYPNKADFIKVDDIFDL